MLYSLDKSIIAGVGWGVRYNQAQTFPRHSARASRPKRSLVVVFCARASRCRACYIDVCKNRHPLSSKGICQQTINHVSF